MFFQFKAFANTGGVIGINGIGDFLGGTHSETVVDHLEYIIDLFGPEHAGLGLDYVVDKQELIDYIQTHPEVFLPNEIGDHLAVVEPEQWPEFTDLLLKRGHREDVVVGILGRNFLRIAETVWKKDAGKITPFSQ